MTDPLTDAGRAAYAKLTTRVLDKGAQRVSDAGAQPAAQAARGLGDDELQLSVVAQAALAEPEFDRAKVETIKEAIQNGRYPLDSRRMAENFVALENMIAG